MELETIAWGYGLVEGPRTDAVAASALQVHPSVSGVLDEAAATELSPDLRGGA